MNNIEEQEKANKLADHSIQNMATGKYTEIDISANFKKTSGYLKYPDGILDICSYFGVSNTKTNMEQIEIFSTCIKVYEKRNARYKDLWEKDGWRGSLFFIRHKIKRLWQQFWIDGGDFLYTEGEILGDKSKLDDAYDAINYLAFFIRNVNNNNEHGSW